MSDITKRIEKQLHQLQLKGLIGLYNTIYDKAVNNKLNHLEFLTILLEEEIVRRQESSTKARISKAKFPFVKTIEAFDFTYQPGLNEQEILKLASLDFVDKKVNIILLGPPGVGKTHLAVGLGLKGCMAKYRVVFITASNLIQELQVSFKAGLLTDRLLYYSRLNLLIIDELGYMCTVTKEQANLLFQLISMRYEKGSIVLTSNYNFDEWNRVFDDTVVASAIIDRLIHHSEIFYINGTSYRLKNKISKHDAEGKKITDKLNLDT